MKIAEADILLVPDGPHIHPVHWQRRWQEKMANARIVADSINERQRLAELRDAIKSATRPTVLVGHGAGAALILRTLVERLTVAGAFLAAPRVPRAFYEGEGDAPGQRARETQGEKPSQLAPIWIIASRDDQAFSFDEAARLAERWGARLIDAGDAGAIDAASGRGPWPEGLMAFAHFMKDL